MTSKSSETTTNIFIFERASREYFTLPNQSPEEGVMAVLLKPHSAECATRGGDFKPSGWMPEGIVEAESSTRPGGFWPPNSTLAGGHPEGTIEAATSTRAGGTWTAKLSGRVAHAETRLFGPFSWNLASNYK
ncbi:uncharacterized protein LOC125216169 [Salvia hispanica]|uniref:uncharacterized protein LOC125216169 n=1 Tax=Salvia hispanica TaxID=49212 RepID=UPI0020096B14|nr:uncharacterized protein LOC125216169 [Salvia hispanica]